MKKILKRIISASVAVMISATYFTTGAFAVSDKAIFEVMSLGIIEGDENNDLHLEEEITRAEFSKMILVLMGYGTAQESNADGGGFTDVSSDAWYSSYVGFAKDIGYINGYDDGTFRPENPILMRDAIKILLTAMKFDVEANQRGGYPDGYLATAIERGFLKGITRAGDQNALRGDIVTLIYNALDINMPKLTYGTQLSYDIVTGNTLRKKLADEAGTVFVRGIMTANNKIWLLTPNSGIGDNEAEIDGEIYTADGIDTSQYIGMEVEGFYYDNEVNGEKELRSIAPTNKNKAIEFDGGLFAEYSKDSIQYYESSDSNKKIRAKLADESVVIYNNRVLSEFSTDEFRELNGTYRMIDNDDDDEYEYIFIREEQNVIADKVFESGEIYFKNTFTLNNARYISIDPDETQSYTVRNADGEEVSFTDIQPDDVLTVVMSRDNTYIEFVASSNKRDITVDQIRNNDEDDYEICCDGEWIKVINRNLELALGNSYTGYFNYKGELVYTVDGESSEDRLRYGYIAKVYPEAWTYMDPDVPMILMLEAGGITNKEEKNDENPDDKNTISTLYASNAAAKKMRLSDKVTINGDSKSVENLDIYSLVGPVIYSLDSDGDVRKIETPEKVGGVEGIEITYNAKEMVFGGSSIYGGFGIDETTKVCCVPSNVGASGNDYLVEIKIDNRDSEQKFDAQGYEFNDITKNVKFLVLSRPMSEQNVKSISYKSSGIGIVTDMNYTQREDGESIYEVTLVTEDGEFRYNTLPISINPALDTLNNNDLIYYELDNGGFIQNVRSIVNIKNDLKVNDHWDIATENEALYGTVKSIDLNTIDVVNTRRADIITVDTGASVEEVTVPRRNAPVVFLYEGDGRNCTVTTTENIREGVDELYVLQPYGSPNVLIIKR